MFNFFKKKKDSKETNNNPPVTRICGLPEYSIKVFKDKEEINNKIPDKVMKEVETELDDIFKDTHKGMGFCHQYWAKKKQLLNDRGYEWFSPKDLNPGAIYD